MSVVNACAGGVVFQSNRITFADVYWHVYCCYRFGKILLVERALALQ